MPRPKRTCPPGDVFHVLNRAVARMTIFEKAEDYDAFLRVLEETWRLVPLPIYAFTVMRYVERNPLRAIIDSELDGRKPKVVIHTIGFWSDQGQELLQRISSKYGGTYRFVPPPPKRKKR